jgi:hypothetical protein
MEPISFAPEFSDMDTSDEDVGVCPLIRTLRSAGSGPVREVPATARDEVALVELQSSGFRQQRRQLVLIETLVAVFDPTVSEELCAASARRETKPRLKIDGVRRTDPKFANPVSSRNLPSHQHVKPSFVSFDDPWKQASRLESIQIANSPPIEV